MKIFMTLIISLCSLTCVAQRTDKGKILHPRIYMSDGTIIETSFDNSTQILNVEVQQNNSEVEVIAVKKGQVVDSNSTLFSDDHLDLDLSTQGTDEIDIFVRNREEIEYVGSVETSENTNEK